MAEGDSKPTLERRMDILESWIIKTHEWHVKIRDSLLLISARLEGSTEAPTLPIPPMHTPAQTAAELLTAHSDLLASTDPETATAAQHRLLAAARRLTGRESEADVSDEALAVAVAVAGDICREGGAAAPALAWAVALVAGVVGVRPGVFLLDGALDVVPGLGAALRAIETEYEMDSLRESVLVAAGWLEGLEREMELR